MDDPKDEAAAAAKGGGQQKRLLARAAAALDRIRHAVVRSSQIGKIKLDSTFLRRERDELLRELGAGVYALARDGSLELPPSYVATLERIERLSEGIAEQERELAEVESEGPPAWEREGGEAESGGEGTPEGGSAGGGPRGEGGDPGSEPREAAGVKG